MFEVELDERGAGSPLVYLPGLFDGPESPLVTGLAEHYRVLVPANPGTAGSRGEEHLWDLHDALCYYLDLLDAIGFERGPLVGHCLGGMFAAELAAIAPDRFSPVVLINPFGIWRDDLGALDLFAATEDELHVALFGSGPPPAFGPSSAVTPDARTPDARTPDARTPVSGGAEGTGDVERRLARARALAGAARFLWPIPDRGLSRRAHRISADTLLIWGSEDRICPLAEGVRLHGLIGGSRLEILDGAGHLPQYSHPEVVLGAVEEFLGG